MIILDTDHISVLQHEDSPKAVALLEKLEALPAEQVATTVATLEEQSRSWLSLIGRYTDVRQQVAYYDRLKAMFEFFAGWQAVRFDETAAEEYQALDGPGFRRPPEGLQGVHGMILLLDTLAVACLWGYPRSARSARIGCAESSRGDWEVS